MTFHGFSCGCRRQNSTAGLCRTELKPALKSPILAHFPSPHGLSSPLESSWVHCQAELLLSRILFLCRNHFPEFHSEKMVQGRIEWMPYPSFHNAETAMQSWLHCFCNEQQGKLDSARTTLCVPVTLASLIFQPFSLTEFQQQGPWASISQELKISCRC